jgi:predicted nucleic-acid-binding protein
VLAIDTNIIVRYLTQDHPEQSPRARALIMNNSIWVSTTVLLEIEWVLRSAYGLTKLHILDALAAFSDLPQVRVEDPDLLEKGLAWARMGMDFADALHLAEAQSCDAFVTFDRNLGGARPDEAIPVQVL